MPYSYSALEPYIDEETVRLHHDKHLKTYVDKLNEILEEYPAYHSWTLDTILTNLYSMPENIRQKVRNNAGGVYNHNLVKIDNEYIPIKPYKKSNKRLEIQDAIEYNFGTVSNFYEAFKKSALDNFGSGYTWLVLDKNSKLKIVNTKNQDTVLELNLYPLLLIDVWEHAYYLKYNNLRSKYIDAFFYIINWNIVNEKYINFL